MEFDLRMLITLGGILVSVVTSAAVARQQIKQNSDKISDLRRKVDEFDLRLDKNDMMTSIHEQRMQSLAGTSSPEAREKLARELEGLKKDVAHLKEASKNV